MVNPQKISLVLSDVDGTLVNEDKMLTERTRTAVSRLRAAGIRFAITSGRPPRGMAMLFEPLELDTPVAGFNGGLFVTPDLAVLERKALPYAVAVEAVDHVRAHVTATSVNPRIVTGPWTHAVRSFTETARARAWSPACT